MNALLRLCVRAYRAVLKLLGARTMGVRILVMNDNQEICLVRHTYMSGWFFPGGGVKKNETTQQAAIRELFEETGIVAQQAPALLGIYHHNVHGVEDTIALYLVKQFEQQSNHSIEIAQIRWFDPHHLPEDTTPGTQRRLQEYLNHQPMNEYW